MRVKKIQIVHKGRNYELIKSVDLVKVQNSEGRSMVSNVSEEIAQFIYGPEVPKSFIDKVHELCVNLMERA